jgi:sodium transport system permease protein
MRWSIIRLIWRRELRDLIRDRRWLFMLLGLPILIYPLFGLVGFVIALSTLELPSVVGICGLENLPQPPPQGSVVGPAAEFGWWAVLPAPSGFGIDQVAGAAAGILVRRRATVDPPLILKSGESLHFLPDFTESSLDARGLQIAPLSGPDCAPLDAKRIDVLLIVPADFRDRLAEGEAATVEVQAREGDELSKLATRRLAGVLRLYRVALRQARFARQGLPPNFDQVLIVRDPDERKPRLQRTTDELRDALIRFFPFMLVMWSLAGALYPAIDLCAGEKERGTMETLLISPADRNEIVAGKFLAVWTLSAVTAWWNLLWMGGGAVLGGSLLGLELVRPSGLVWCFVLTLPLAALFSALCLALGVYARSTKEGQYYLLPIFLVTMPLVMASLAPGVELSVKTSLIPVTGLCLLLQKLIFAPAEGAPWVYLPPVLLSLAVCIALALRWAVAQFHREDVLFRESERPSWRVWLRGLFRPPVEERQARAEP